MTRGRLLAAALVLVALTASPALGADGGWERAWGKNVIGGAPTGFEICVDPSRCRPGIAGGLGGEMMDPEGVATDPSGNVYVADPGGQRIQKFDARGNWERAWGKDVRSGGGSGFEICTIPIKCKPGAPGGLGGEMNQPLDVAADAAGNVYVLEFLGERVQKFDSLGNFERAWGLDVVTGGGTGPEICTVASSCKAGASGPGTGPLIGGSVYHSRGVAADAFGNVYVAEGISRISKFDSLGNFERTWGKDVIAGGGTDFEICTIATSCKEGVVGNLGGEMESVVGLATDSAGHVYAADWFRNRMTRYDSSGNFELLWGKDVVRGDGTGAEICTVASDCKGGEFAGLGGEFSEPTGVATDTSGAVYVIDSFNQRVQKFDAAGGFKLAWGRDVVAGGRTGFEVCSVAANCKPGRTGGLGGEMNDPESIASTASGVVYVADESNLRIQKFVDATGPPSTRFTARPPNRTDDRTARFEYASSDPGSSFECSLDGKAFRSCGASNTVRVNIGAHVFRVRAVNALGKVDPSPARDRWTRCRPENGRRRGMPAYAASSRATLSRSAARPSARQRLTLV